MTVLFTLRGQLLTGPAQLSARCRYTTGAPARADWAHRPPVQSSRRPDPDAGRGTDSEGRNSRALRECFENGLVSLRDDSSHANLPDGPYDQRMRPTDELLSSGVPPGSPAQMGDVADAQ